MDQALDGEDPRASLAVSEAPLSTMIPPTFLLLLSQLAVASWPEKNLQVQQQQGGNHPRVAGCLKPVLKNLFPAQELGDQPNRE